MQRKFLDLRSPSLGRTLSQTSLAGPLTSRLPRPRIPTPSSIASPQRAAPHHHPRTMNDPIRTLETTRQRLHHLVHAIVSFQQALHSTPPLDLPAPSILQSHFSILSSALDSLTSTLSAHFPATATQTLVSYPLPTFPAAQQEILLTTLLTKRLRPEIKDAVEEAAAQAREESEELRQTREAVWEKVAGMVAKVVLEAEVREDEARKGLVGVLRFASTGVPVAEQTKLPKALGVVKK